MNGVVGFVGAENYAGTFGFQWHKYAWEVAQFRESFQSEGEMNRFTGTSPCGLWAIARNLACSVANTKRRVYVLNRTLRVANLAGLKR